MKNLFVIVCLFMAMMFVGCVTGKPAFHANMPSDSVYIDPYNSWANQCPTGKCDSPFRSVSVRVVNTKYRDVSVTVKCVFMPEEVVFGETTSVVKNRDDAIILVLGTSRIVPDPESVRCKIISVR